MMNKKVGQISCGRFRFVLLFALLLCVLPGSIAFADTRLLPMAEYNMNSSMIHYSALEPIDNGYLRVFCVNEKIYAETYDLSFTIQSRRKIPKELDMYGGFFNGKDAYYFVFGKDNPEEKPAAEVLRVVKYDRNWNRIGAACITGGSESEFGHDVRYIFEYGNVTIDECDGMLYIATGHCGYVDPNVGQGHQGLIMFQVNEATMTGRILLADFWHSFSQHLSIKDSQNIYLLEMSEGSEQSQITRIAVDPDGNLKEADTIQVLKYGGVRPPSSSRAIATYASADAIAYSDDYVLAAGASIDQSRYYDDSYEKVYNIYLTATPINDFTEEKTRVSWVTKDNLRNGYRNIQLTKISSDRFMLSWEQRVEDKPLTAENDLDKGSLRVLHYVFLNGAGEVVSPEYKKAAALSNCEPVVKDGKVHLYTAGDTDLSFYTIDPQNGNLSKNVFFTAGENATWSLKKGVLTITGTGPIFTNHTIDETGVYVGLQHISSKVKKLVISDGITEIGEEAFMGLEELKNVTFGKDVKVIHASAFAECYSLKNVSLPNGLKQIGDKAFYRNLLGRINIPKSVKIFGKQIFETGYYWVNSKDNSRVPAFTATVYCEKGSAALRYAKQAQAPYQVVGLKLAEKKAKANGKAIEAGKITKKGLSGKVAIHYYTDAACKTATTAKNSGAKGEGQAPVWPGIYYAKAQTVTDEGFGIQYSNVAKVEITSTEKYPIKNGSISKATLAKGQYITDTKTKAVYKVTKVTSKKGTVTGGTLTYLKPSVRNVGSIVVPDTVKISGISLKVTAIGNSAFKDLKKLKKLTVGKNIVSIGAGAFRGCKNLKQITILTQKLTAKGIRKNTWSGLPAKAVIKTPKKVKATYAKWFYGKGLDKKIAVK